MRKDTDFIYDAVSKVEELTGMQIEYYSNRVGQHGVISIKDFDFSVYPTSNVRNSNVGKVLGDVEIMSHQSKRPIVIVSKYISKEATTKFRERRINFLDVSGNSLIKNHNIFIFISGQRSELKEKLNQSRAFQEAGLKIIFQLLSNPESIYLSYRGLAEAAQVSIGSVSNVMKELEEMNYIVRNEERRILKNKIDLLERWVTAYHETLRPRITRKRMRFIYQMNNNSWQQLIQRQMSLPVFWGGEPGAALKGTNLRPENYTIYSNAEISELAKTYELVPDRNGNVEILKQFWTPAVDSVKTTPSLLIYSDLINSGSGRNLEIANQILDNDLQFIK